MGREIQKRRLILTVLAAFAAVISSFAQETPGQTDSLVRLMQAETLQILEEDGHTFRKTIAPTFLHNGTYLICDTALWNVDTKLINCIGHVQLIQDETLLTSDKLDYLIDEDLAQFRGGLVELRNKQNNILRTRNLDYNTKDSLASFRSGASMRSAEGQVIESDEGTYSNSQSLFTFRSNVNMYTDSVFVKTEELLYNSKSETAEFPVYVDFWNEENMLSADKGRYERKPDIFFFRGRVHGQTDTREMWSDSLYFYKKNNNVLLLGNAQVQDSTRKTTAVADHIFYEDSLALVTMKNNAALALRTEQKEKIDTIYCGADTLIYQAIRKCDIPEAELNSSAARLEEMRSDAIASYRKKVAEEAAAAALQALKDKEDDLGLPEGTLTQKNASGPASKAKPLAGKADLTAAPSSGGDVPPDEAPAADTTSLAAGASIMPSDSLGVLSDSLGTALDSLAAAADSLALSVPKDTTKISFIKAIKNVRIFRNDIQARCDSLVYNDLDSIARFYLEPIVWNEGNRQYTADSLFVLVSNGGVEKANLMSNPFVVTQEDSLLFDQIKGAEIVAYFDEDSNLKRFDALGGASALFYIQENDTFATANKVESKLFYATLKEGEVDHIYYFDAPVNNAYPIVQLPPEEQKMKGFNWDPASRPVSRYDVTTLEVKPSERSAYSARPRAEFKHTERYFPGHMKSIHERIENARLRREADRARRDSLGAAGSLAVMDSLSVDAPDSLALRDSLIAADSLAVKDSLAVAADSLGTAVPDEEYMSPSELRRALRIAKRDARWEALDARDAAKAAEKQKRKDARKQKREDRLAARLAEQDRKDREKLEKYIERYQKQKARNEGKHKPEPSGELPSGAEAGGELQTVAGS